VKCPSQQQLTIDVWFLLAYTGYVVVSILALIWVGGDDEHNNSDKTFRQATQRLGGRQ
jgi:hypothetical protein